MKLTNLETKTGAGKGAFLHLKHPALGHYLYTGKGADDLGRKVEKDAQAVGVHVLGMESERVREQAKTIKSRKLKGDDDAEEAGIEFVSTLITEFVGIEDADGNSLKATDEAKREFLSQSDGLLEQILDFAGDRANFWRVGSTG